MLRNLAGHDASEVVAHDDAQRSPGLLPARERHADAPAAAVLDRCVAERDALEERTGRVGVQRVAGRPAEHGAGVGVDGRGAVEARDLGLDAGARGVAHPAVRASGMERVGAEHPQVDLAGSALAGEREAHVDVLVADLGRRVPVARADVDEASGERVDLVARQLPERAREVHAPLRERHGGDELGLVQRIRIGDPERRAGACAARARRRRSRAACPRARRARAAPWCSTRAAPRSRARACGWTCARSPGAASRGTRRRSGGCRRGRQPDRGRARGSSSAAARGRG